MRFHFDGSKRLLLYCPIWHASETEAIYTHVTIASVNAFIIALENHKLHYASTTIYPPNIRRIYTYTPGENQFTVSQITGSSACEIIQIWRKVGSETHAKLNVKNRWENRGAKKRTYTSAHTPYPARAKKKRPGSEEGGAPIPHIYTLRHSHTSIYAHAGKRAARLAGKK